MCRPQTSASSCREPAACASMSSDSVACCANWAISKPCFMKSSRAAREKNTPASAGGSIMLTGNMVRVRYARDQVIPLYLDVNDAQALQIAEQLLDIFRTSNHKSRGQLEQEID